MQEWMIASCDTNGIIIAAGFLFWERKKFHSDQSGNLLLAFERKNARNGIFKKRRNQGRKLKKGRYFIYL